MKRMTPFPLRAGLGAGVFILTLACLGSTHVFAFGALQRQTWDQLAMFLLLLIWSFIAYFPAKWVYLAATFKHFNDGIHCEGCGYDLTGNRSGRCSECGRVFWRMWSRMEPQDSNARSDRKPVSRPN